MRSVLVTGGAGGIGLEICRGLYSLGWQVFLADKNEKAVHEAVSQLSSQAGGSVHGIVCDITQDGHIRNMCVQISVLTCRLDALIFSAGVFLPKASITSDGTEIHHATHVLGPAHVFEALKPMLHSGARILFSACRIRIPRSKTYRSSKAQAEELCSVLAKENPSLNFYNVDPGLVYTDLLTRHMNGLGRLILSFYRRYGASAGKASGGYIVLCQSAEPLPSGYYKDRKKFIPFES